MAGNQDLAKIHIGKKQLGLDDDTYQMMLKTLTGKTSAKDLTADECQQVIGHMVSKGANLTTRNTKPTNADWRTPRIQKIRRLWTEMATVNVVNANGLTPWLRRQHQIERLEWASSEHLNNVIHALQQWAIREDVKSVIEYESNRETTTEH